MKMIKIWTTLISLLIVQQAITQSDSIYAIVSGDTVTIWHEAAFRNCGALYKNIIENQDHVISWYQVDTGDAAFCICYFDLSVSFLVDEPGNYDVQVYYSESYFPDVFFYSGSTSFYIGGSSRFSDIVSEFQSECYWNVGIADHDVGTSNHFKIYPIPAGRSGLINLEFYSEKDGAIFEILALTGKRLYRKHYSENGFIRDQLNVSDLLPVAGVFLVRITTGNETFVTKLPFCHP